MIPSRSALALSWSAAALIAGLGTAAAQQAQPAQSAPTPQLTTATYEDWIVRCESRAGPPPQKNCEMVQFTQVQGQAGVLTQIAIGRPNKGDPVKVVIQVPINVWLPTGVRLALNDKDKTALNGAFKRCVPNACFADVEVKDDVLKKLRASAEPGQIGRAHV